MEFVIKVVLQLFPAEAILPTHPHYITHTARHFQVAFFFLYSKFSLWLQEAEQVPLLTPCHAYCQKWAQQHWDERFLVHQVETWVSGITFGKADLRGGAAVQRAPPDRAATPVGWDFREAWHRLLEGKRRTFLQGPTFSHNSDNLSTVNPLGSHIWIDCKCCWFCVLNFCCRIEAWFPHSTQEFMLGCKASWNARDCRDDGISYPWGKYLRCVTADTSCERKQLQILWTA